MSETPKDSEGAGGTPLTTGRALVAEALAARDVLDSGIDRDEALLFLRGIGIDGEHVHRVRRCDTCQELRFGLDPCEMGTMNAPLENRPWPVSQLICTYFDPNRESLDDCQSCLLANDGDRNGGFHLIEIEKVLENTRERIRAMVSVTADGVRYPFVCGSVRGASSWAYPTGGFTPPSAVAQGAYARATYLFMILRNDWQT